MRPPECYLCGKEENCDLVYFKKRPSDIEWEKRMKEEGMVGHPPYAEWFCDLHVGEARALAGKPDDEVKKLLKARS